MTYLTEDNFNLFMGCLLGVFGLVLIYEAFH